MRDFQNLVDICKGNKVYIQTHNFPDPDAIGAGYGLQKLLAYYGIESTFCYVGRIDKLNTKKMTELFQIAIFPYEQICDGMTEEDYIICVDSQKGSGNIKDITGREIAVIDHHPVFIKRDYLYEDIRITGSCCTLIAEYFKDLQVPLNGETASALLYGLKMDTLQFTRGVTCLDIQMFEYLYEKADRSALQSLERNTMEFNDLKAYGAAIENIVIYDKVGFAGIPFSCPDALIAIISDFILALQEVEVSVIYSIREDGIKFSVRSEAPQIHAGVLAQEVLKEYGNGGGHAFMAGGLIRKENQEKLGKHPEQTIIEMFMKEIEKESREGDAHELE